MAERPLPGMVSRLYLALGHLQGIRKRKVSQAELGKDVAKKINRTEGDYSQGVVSEWFDKGIRDVDAAWGFAQVCGVREAWLVFNDGQMLPEKAGEQVEEKPLDRMRVAEEPSVEA